MYDQEIIQKTEEYVKSVLQGDSSGHDWWHIYRVRNLARYICRAEKAELYIVELAALLHDIADWKFHGGDDSIGPKTARAWLEKQSAGEEVMSHICEIIKDISFKGAKVETPMQTLEGKVVQDADRLDALGAIGISRVFAYVGAKGSEIYNPDIPVKLHSSFDEYKSKSTAINHFYEKLLLLKDRMNTETAKKIAEKRHKVMEEYLKQFFMEWDGMDFT